jgi:hypothetical protein
MKSGAEYVQIFKTNKDVEESTRAKAMYNCIETYREIRAVEEKKKKEDKKKISLMRMQ